MTWAPGTILVCIRDLSTRPSNAPGKVPCPKVNEYVTCHEHYEDGRSPTNGVVELREYRPDLYWYCDDAFRPAESAHSEAGSFRREEPVSA